MFTNVIFGSYAAVVVTMKLLLAQALRTAATPFPQYIALTTALPY